MGRRQLISENREAQEWVAAQFFSDVKAVLAQSALAGRKSGDQANFHCFAALANACALMTNRERDVVADLLQIIAAQAIARNWLQHRSIAG